MSIDRALQWTTAAVAVVGALFLAVGHESGWLPALLALAAAASVLVTDLVPWLRLNRIIANLIAVAAVIWSLYDFLARTPDQQLMAISQMLVFLQVLLLFQEKTGRTYWQLLVLSLLQVVVAAALNTGLEFGFLLTAYMLLSVLALVLLCIHRDLSAAQLSPPKPPSSTGPEWTTLLAQPEVTLHFNGLADWRTCFRPWLLTRQVAVLTAAAVGFTLIFFYVTPRLGEGTWQTTRRGGHSTTGLSEQLTVEESGRIHQSNQVVMRATFTDVPSGKPYVVLGEPYFQGAVLTHYAQNETGSRWYYGNTQLAVRPRLREPRNSGLPVVRQDYVLELLSSPWAFAVFPVQWLSPGRAPRGLRYERIAGRISADLASGPVSVREYRYGCLTTALRGGRQLRAVPAAASFSDASLLEDELLVLRTFESSRFPGLQTTASQAIEAARVDMNNPLAKAKALELHFNASGLYRYSLDLSFPRNRNLDPIEDFVVNHRLGHCEYFASALVLMLRSQGIPARMVVGYKGGEYNMLGHYYVVRQKHAHAWVEAWIPSDVVPESEMAGTPNQGGFWYRLDPTPRSTDFLAQSRIDGLRDKVFDAFDYLDLLWRDYVVNLNSFRQQEAVTDPDVANTFGALPDWIDSQSAGRQLREWGERLGLRFRRGPTAVSQRVFDWRYAAVIAGGLILTIGIANLGMAASHRVYVLLGWRSNSRAVNRAPKFYRRLERLLARLRLRRASGQTPRELALEASNRLADGGGDRQLAEVPGEIVESYYRVRFGGATLDNSETVAIEQALATLVPAVTLVSKASPAQKR